MATGDRDDPRVWSRPARVGYGSAVEGAGLTAAPLVAGSSFILLALVISADHGGDGISAVPELAALLFLGAGLLLVFCVQFAFRTRGFTAGPGALADWMPEETAPSSEAGAEARLAPGAWEAWTPKPRRVGDRWVSGRPRRRARLSPAAGVSGRGRAPPRRSARGRPRRPTGRGR